jgi:predicted dehydrogenase
MMNPLRMGIVGCGDIAHAHGEASRQIRDKVQFVSSCDIVLDRAEAWAERYGAERAYTDYEEMLRQEQLDGVLLATWPNHHREQIERCLELGVRNILCEKSLTLTSREALEIWALVQEHDAFLMEGFMYRHHPALKKLEALVASGAVGPLDHVRAAFSATFDGEALPDDPTRDWRLKKEAAGGVPFDFACYAVNACGHFSKGLPTRVSAFGFLSQYDTIDRLYGLIEYDNGRVGVIESSHQSVFDQSLDLSGADGLLHLPIAWTIDGPVTIDEVHAEDWGKLLTTQHPIPAADAYQLEQENFADVVQGRAAPGMPLAQSVVNTFALEALVTSVETRQPVEISVPDEIAQAVRGYWEAAR